MSETKRERSTEERIAELADDIRATGLGPEESARLARKFEGERRAIVSVRRRYDNDASIVYVDPQGERHAALVKVWWGEGSDHPGGRCEPSCNVVYVYGGAGSGVATVTEVPSVVHKSLQGAPGNFWCWPDEA